MYAFAFICYASKIIGFILSTEIAYNLLFLVFLRAVVIECTHMVFFVRGKVSVYFSNATHSHA